MASRRARSTTHLPVVLLVTTLLVAALLTTSPGAAAAAGPPEGRGRPLEGRWIVTLVQGSDAPRMADEERRGGATIAHVYRSALAGFAGTLSDAQVARLRRDPRVASVEQDQLVTATATQGSATWGLDRLDQRALPLDATYRYGATGAGVHAYVIDSGLHLAHAQLAGRVGNGFDVITSGGDASDCNGHGTHVTATIAGTVHGVAKEATVHPVRVLDCAGSGTWSGVIAGVDWVTANAVRPAVANMSLGGGTSTAVDDAVRRSIASGITYVVAAGNDNVSACGASPARVAQALTVGATDRLDARASFSNFGSCVDLFAPGVAITSAWHTTPTAPGTAPGPASDTAVHTISGTSMASPHVAGVVATRLEGTTGMTPAAVEAAIEGDATVGKVTGAGTGSPNLLLHAPAAATPPPPPPAGPTAPTDVTGRGYLVNGRHRIDLTWTRGTGPNVELRRNGTLIVTTADDGLHTDKPGRKNPYTYTYTLCVPGTSTCSAPVSVTF